MRWIARITKSFLSTNSCCRFGVLEDIDKTMSHCCGDIVQKLPIILMKKKISYIIYVSVNMWHIGGLAANTMICSSSCFYYFTKNILPVPNSATKHFCFYGSVGMGVGV